MLPCHCGSEKAFALCCAPIISGDQAAASAESLMRARYSAYVEGAIEFLGESLHPDQRHDWDEAATRRWADRAEWLGLEIREVVEKGPEEAEVEFIARFKEDGISRSHQERSRFRRDKGSWFYWDGQLPKPQTQRNEQAKVGRNDPCPCGSGRKYKKCCGR